MSRKGYNRSYYLTHKLDISIQQKDYYKNHRDKKLEYSKSYSESLRLEVLTHYGGNPPKCACCGESHVEFLTLDHINNDGAKQRKQFGRGSRFYRWIKKNNFPEGYRVLCYNCNCSLGHYGVCPHVGTA